MITERQCRRGAASVRRKLGQKWVIEELKEREGSRYLIISSGWLKLCYGTDYKGGEGWWCYFGDDHWHRWVGPRCETFKGALMTTIDHEERWLLNKVVPRMAELNAIGKRLE